MSKNAIFFLLGILVMVMPFLGFPSSWKSVFFFLVGLTMVVVTFTAHLKKRKIIMESRREVVTEVYVESNGHHI